MSAVEPLIAGTVVGFRQFRLDSAGRLLPLHAGSRAWDPAGTEAACARHPGHRPPVAECSCGLYAWHHAADALSRCDDDTTVVAAVRAHGRVLLGEHGLRAERAEVVALCLPARWTARRRARVAAQLRAAHPEVALHTSPRTFRRAYAAEPLDALGVRTRPTAHARLAAAVHVPWVLGVVALYSVVVWPPALDRVMASGGWAVLLAVFVLWQAWLVSHALDDDA
ncbi:hypothetical protein [Nocardioides daejeonensis]|uniref:hypothetical protein n=1 Tax=Nocardioides daejeonensis TaxID=1046556 RepID=UPI000D74BE78|nr:hypothetical protein [Nocardioides daejeonensis]